MFSRSNVVICFNSCKVRLGVFADTRMDAQNFVSIPARFDWETSTREIEQTTNTFQFLQGSIGSVRRQWRRRTEHVSIPARFDWEGIILVEYESISLFQFLQGSIGSLTSIPEGFNPTVFQFLQGSIGSMYGGSGAGGQSSFNSCKVRLGDKILPIIEHQPVVSIPARFDWEVISAMQLLIVTQFQFLQGSIGRYKGLN